MQKLNATQLVSWVLKKNPNIPELQAKGRAAQAYSVRAGALADPYFSYTLAPDTRNQVNRDRGEKLMFSQKLPWFGKRRLRRQAALAQAEAISFDINTLKANLIKSARIGFADWFYVHRAIKINQSDQRLWKEYHRIAIKKYGLGRASKQDALKAEMRIAMLRHGRIILLKQKKLVQVFLNQLLNLLPTQQLPPPEALVLSKQQLNIAQLREILALNAKFKALSLGVKLAKREYYPDLKISAGYNSLWNDKNKRSTIGIGINLPFGGRKRRAAVDQSKAKKSELGWAIQRRRTAILANVQTQYENVMESRHTLKLFNKSLLPLSKEHLHAAKSDYQAGKGDH